MNALRTRKTPIIVRAIISIVVLAALIAIIIYVNKEFNINAPQTSHGDAPDGYDSFAAAVDTDFSLALAQQISELGDDPATGYRTSGSPAEIKAATLIEQTMKDIGLQNVTIDEAVADSWIFNGASIIYKNQNDESIKIDLGSYPIEIAEDKAEYPLVYVSRGYNSDYAEIDATGKIVLVELNPSETFKTEFVVYQAYMKGAKAVLLVNIEDAIEKRLVNRNIRGISVIPVFSISRKDANSLIDIIETPSDFLGENSENSEEASKEIRVTLTANNKISLNESTNNVWGEIPGVSEDVIYFSSHYDGFYHAFYDGATEVGLTLGIAKAMIESGYVPQKTIRFVMNGAGEWGRSSVLRNQNIGASQQISMVRPEWADSIFTLFSINCGLPFPDSTQLILSVPFEYKTFIESTIASFGDRAKKTEISVVGELPPMDRSDAVYRSIGIPTVTNSRSHDIPDYYGKMYHSSGDIYLEKGFNKELAESIIQYYGYTTLMFDELLITPFDIGTRITEIKESYGVSDSMGEYVDSHLLANADRVKESANRLDYIVSSTNEAYLKAKRDNDQVKMDEYLKRAPEIQEQLNKVYRLIQENFYKLNLGLEYEFGHEELQENIAALNTAVNYLTGGEETELALDVLNGINMTFYSTLFDKETYDYIQARVVSTAMATWDSSLEISKVCNVSDVLAAIEAKIVDAEDEMTLYDSEVSDIDFSAEIAEIERLRDEQAAALTKLYSAQSFAYVTIMDEINRIVDLNTSN